jgi:hypothetical protein
MGIETNFNVVCFKDKRALERECVWTNSARPNIDELREFIV